MGLDLARVHDYQRIPGTLEVRLIKTNPYVRIVNGGNPPIFIQGGVLYSEGGQVVTEIPDWFSEEVAKLSDLVRAEVGLKGEDDEGGGPQPKPKPPKVEVEPWVCPQCQKSMPPRGKTFHELWHKKQAVKGAQHGDADG